MAAVLGGYSPSGGRDPPKDHDLLVDRVPRAIPLRQITQRTGGMGVPSVQVSQEVFDLLEQERAACEDDLGVIVTASDFVRIMLEAIECQQNEVILVELEPALAAV